MLAKQSWRIATKHESLVSKIYKGRYFKYSSFLKADTGSSPSWAWRSLLEGMKVIEKGLIWQIGNGGSVKIFEVLWIRNFRPISVYQQQNVSSDIIRVNQLLKENRTWDAELIQSIFNSDIAASILQTTINEEEHRITWANEKSGHYSVASGYQIAFFFFHSPID
ncbi:hypothetical protein AHAS_Ahas05G0014200 [Arachis hypogaea]